MRVKYSERVISLYPNVAGGTSQNWVNFCTNILEFLAEAGAPFNADSFDSWVSSTSTTTYGSGEVNISYVGEPANEEEAYEAGFYPAGIDIGVYPPSSSSGNVVMEIHVRGRNTESGIQNYFYYDVNLGPRSSNGFSVTVRAIKSGNSLYFGIVGYDGFPYGAFINFAITPMRRLSRPDETVGYATLAGAATGFTGSGYFPDVSYSRTLPLIEGYNYMAYGPYSFFPAAPILHMYPEVESGKIQFTPYFTGCEDIYYENIYVTPMRNDGLEEKAFETDKGAFLISNSQIRDPNNSFVNWAIWPHCQLAFDITEATSNI